ncbi:MAG: Sua5/YciO/YrdC/YwlC family protein, partial [Thermoanaerobaculum sp.]|nr:Sua5/YciO/YrdC/YwlC family protein [Thermoanaerobaculum sp.]MDW7966772.1 Sua5/YciO/YrdC/YwlC family protein [Thermoanaerobaculum sp.]
AQELAVVEPLWLARLENLWPAPLTVVFPARRPLPGSGNTVALRVPALHLLRRLLVQVGPLTATSANRSGEPPAQRPEELRELVPGLDLLLDGGTTTGGLPSTLVDATTTPPRLLRQGAFPPPADWFT